MDTEKTTKTEIDRYRRLQILHGILTMATDSLFDALDYADDFLVFGSKISGKSPDPTYEGIWVAHVYAKDAMNAISKEMETTRKVSNDQRTNVSNP